MYMIAKQTPAHQKHLFDVCGHKHRTLTGARSCYNKLVRDNIHWDLYTLDGAFPPDTIYDAFHGIGRVR